MWSFDHLDANRALALTFINMPYVKIWLHCVWGTKGRVSILLPEKKLEITRHILSNAAAKGIYIDFINGYSDHLHCLLLLKHDQSLSKVMQLIKGESSWWINRNKIIRLRFEWADEYYGASVSQSHVNRVREYIKNQEAHHRWKSWEEECEEFVNDNDFSIYKG